MTSIAIDRTDGLSSAAAIKGPCRVATTANIALSGLQTIDGVVLVDNDRVLVKDQSAGSENGIWVADTGPWRRSKDFNKTKDVVKGTLVNVTDGTQNINTVWAVTSSNPIVIGVTALTFVLTPAPSSMLPAIVANTMLVDNAAGDDRENKTFNEVRIMLDQSISSGMAPASSAAANAAALATALASSAGNGLPVQPAFGTLPLAVASVGEIPSGASIIGLGPYLTLMERTGTDPGLNVDDGANVKLSGFGIDMKYSVGSVSGHGIRSQGANNFLVENVRVINFAYNGTSGGGTGVLVAATDDATRPQNPRLRDLHLEADNTGAEAFGWIFDRTDNGFVRDVYSKGAVGNAIGTGMAHELKNIARYNIMTGMNAEASSIGLGFGQQSVGTFDGATNNIFSALLAHGCDAGFVTSKGQGNLGYGLMYVLDTGKPNTRTKYAFQFDSNSRSNAIYASLATSTVDAAADFEDGARHNYAQFYSSVTGNLAKYQTGTTRNVVDVVHPGGTESSILALISDTSGNSTRGSAANVTYSMATGERVGSLSGTFHDRLESSGAAFNAAHYWRDEALTTVIRALGHNGTTGNIAGISVAVPGDANRAAFQHQIGASAAADFWALRGYGGSARYSWEQNIYRPTADNVVSNGSAATRWSVIYAGTGTINTSDANEKTKPLPIDDAVLDAWGDVRLICFQWLNAVAEKGADAARLHVGVIAQQVRDAFEGHGIDGRRYGLLCHDTWDDMLEDVYEEVEREVVHEFEVMRDTGRVTKKGKKILVKELETRTEIIKENVKVGEQVVTPAGERWGIREGQCLFLEAAYMRRRCERMEDRLAALEKAS